VILEDYISEGLTDHLERRIISQNRKHNHRETKNLSRRPAESQ